MERKIGFTPIPRSGKERVLKVELLPQILNYGAEDRICTIPRSGKERVLKVELLPHKPGGGNRI